MHQLPTVAAPRRGVECRLRADGLTVVGVHTPEFAFEHVVSNITAAAAQLGVHYPIAVDNNYATWNAYQNSYWPAEYLIDATGTVRHVDFGEGQYGQTETFIRQLLVRANPTVVLPPRTDVADRTPQDQTTPESYLGYNYQESNLDAESVVPDTMTAYRLRPTCPRTPMRSVGSGTSGRKRPPRARMPPSPCSSRPRTCTSSSAGRAPCGWRSTVDRSRTVTVSGEPRLYQLVGPGAYQQGTLILRGHPRSPGLRLHVRVAAPTAGRPGRRPSVDRVTPLPV